MDWSFEPSRCFLKDKKNTEYRIHKCDKTAVHNVAFFNNNNNNRHLYCAVIHQVWCSWRMNIITPVIGPVISFLEPSRLPGEYATHAAKCVAQQA